MENILKDLIPLDLSYYTIDIGNFKKFENGFKPFIDNQRKYLNPLLSEHIWPEHTPSTEKQLEYYLSIEFLNLSKDDIYIDIASCLSLFPSYVQEKIGCQTYRQDILYTNIPVENLIASDACNLPVKNDFFSAITLHCSYEHFEEDKDIEFLKEAARVLKPGGKMVILPFYLGSEYTIMIKPKYAPGCQFQRFYDPWTVKERMFDTLDDAYEYSLMVINNAEEVDASCYCRYALLLTRKNK